ncbi:MAG: GatB/YqeY domain-containing protein [Chthoniobacterales bacterium]
MSLSQQIDNDIKDAMRAKDTVKLSVLRMLKASVKNAAIEKLGADGTLEDADVMPVIRKQIKQREDAVEGFVKGGREDLAQKERDESVILQTYLPKPLSGEEVAALVKEAIAEAGATSKAQMGAVMKVLQSRVEGRVDGKTLSSEVQRQLP